MVGAFGEPEATFVAGQRCVESQNEKIVSGPGTRPDE
jgi:hypothetical protein